MPALGQKQTFHVLHSRAVSALEPKRQGLSIRSHGGNCAVAAAGSTEVVTAAAVAFYRLAGGN